MKVGVFVTWQKCTASSSQGYNTNVLRSQKRDVYLVPATERERDKEERNEYHVASPM
jgi:hypothetical protein